MLILGIDTSGRQGSVALLRADSAASQDTPRTLELAPLEGGQYSEQLVPTTAGLLERHGIRRDALGLIAVASGPGSFTGLRIAIATVKGLAEAFATPVVAVSVLEALALESPVGGRTLAALDAQRSEIFFGDYLVERKDRSEKAAQATLIHEAIVGFEGFKSEFAAREIITPDEAVAQRLREAGVEVRMTARPDAEVYARIAYQKFCDGVRSDVETLDANYLRRSDAEIFSAPKLGIAPA